MAEKVGAGEVIQGDAGLLSHVRLWHILLIALVLRLIWAALVPVRPISDPLAYDELAQQLALGHGYSWSSGAPTAYWPVGTAAIYGALYWLFGHDMSVVAVFNSVLGTMLVAATFALARTFFRHSVALLAALLSAIWPSWIAFTTIISSEIPSNIFFVAGMTCALWPRGSGWSRTVASSALLTGAAYFRANLLPFALLVPILAAIAEGKPRQVLMRGTISLVVCVVLVAPWSVRNLHMVGAAAPISTNFGVNLWIGNNPQATGGYVEPPPPDHEPLPQGEAAQDRVYEKHAVAFIAKNPGQYVLLCFRRLRIAFDRETFGVAWNDLSLDARAKAPLKLLMTVYWYLILLAGLGGLAMFLRRSPSNVLSPFVLLPVVAMSAPILVMSSERFHYAIAPFIAIFAAYSATQWTGKRAVQDPATESRLGRAIESNP